jgi:predicted flavoprotein YhiN
LNDLETDEAEKILKALKQNTPKKAVSVSLIPNRLWESLVLASGIEAETKWADLSKTQLQNLSNQLTNGTFQEWKSTLKKNLLLPVELI